MSGSSRSSRERNAAASCERDAADEEVFTVFISGSNSNTEEEFDEESVKSWPLLFCCACRPAVEPVQA